MKNVLIFALGGNRYAVELRWVREIVSLGHVTPVPTAPPIIEGAMNFRGSIVSVLGPGALVGAHVQPPEKARRPRTGDSVILIDVEGTRAAIAAERIDEVTTLIATREGPDQLVDTRGQPVGLIDPQAIVANARAQVSAAVASRAGDGSRT
jgi:chemotaxis signal transduction protein